MMSQAVYRSLPSLISRLYALLFGLVFYTCVVLLVLSSPIHVSTDTTVIIGVTAAVMYSVLAIFLLWLRSNVAQACAVDDQLVEGLNAAFEGMNV